MAVSSTRAITITAIPTDAVLPAGSKKEAGDITVLTVQGSCSATAGLPAKASVTVLTKMGLPLQGNGLLPKADAITSWQTPPWQRAGRK